jgi:hypothetical protein
MIDDMDQVEAHEVEVCLSQDEIEQLVAIIHASHVPGAKVIQVAGIIQKLLDARQELLPSPPPLEEGP